MDHTSTGADACIAALGACRSIGAGRLNTCGLRTTTTVAAARKLVEDGGAVALLTAQWHTADQRQPLISRRSRRTVIDSSHERIVSYRRAATQPVR